MTDDFLLPGVAVDFLQLIELLFWKIQAGPVDIFVKRSPADRRFFGARAAVHAVYNPLQHSKIVAETRPQKSAFFILAEPVHVENARRHAKRTLHFDPVAEIVAHVVTAKGKHSHWIAANLADLASRGGSHFRAHRRT